MKLAESTLVRAIDLLFYSMVAGFGFCLGCAMFMILIKTLSEHV